MNLLKAKPQQRGGDYPKMAMPFRVMNNMMKFIPLRSKFSIDYILFQKKLFPGVIEEEVQRNGIVFRQAKKGDVQHIKDNTERYLPEVYMNRLVDGHGLFCAVKDDEVISFVWYNFQFLCTFYGTPHEIRMGRLGKNSAYLYDLYTFNKFRGQGIAATLLQYVSAYFSNSGIASLSACVSPANLPSVFLYRKLGYRPADLFHVYRIQGIKKCFRGTRQELKTLQHWTA